MKACDSWKLTPSFRLTLSPATAPRVSSNGIPWAFRCYTEPPNRKESLEDAESLYRFVGLAGNAVFVDRSDNCRCDIAGAIETRYPGRVVVLHQTAWPAAPLRRLHRHWG